MTEKQSTVLVNNPHTKKALAILRKFAEMEAEYKTLEKESKAATETIKEAMLASGVNKVTIDTEGVSGFITLAERVSYRTPDIMDVDPQYRKPVLDTDKVKAEAVLTGDLPYGVEESRTHYIIKKLKIEE